MSEGAIAQGALGEAPAVAEGDFGEVGGFAGGVSDDDFFAAAIAGCAD